MPKASLQPHKPRHLQNHVLPPVQSLPLRSLFGENAAIIGKSIAGTLLFIPFWLVFGLCIAIGNTIGSIRAMLGSSRIPQAETADLLAALDSMWLNPPASKNPPSVANVVMKLGDGISMKDFVDILTNRLLNVKNPRGPPPFLYMRFRQRLYTIPGSSRSVFAFSPRFDIANHIHQIPPDVDNTEKLMAFAQQIAANPFEPEKPLWDMHIRTDFGPEKCGILLFRFHQCITDGQSMIQALCRDILDGGDQIYPLMKPRFGGMTYASHFCKAVFMAAYIFITDLMSPGPSDLNILKHPETKLTGKYEIFWSEPVNLSVIQRLKSITRCRFNDILFTALAATLRTYCKMHGVSTPADMTACFPVDLRSGRGEGINDLVLGNKCVMDKIHLPVSQEAGMPQLWRVRDQTHQMRHGYRHVALDFLMKILQKALSQRMLHGIWNRYFSGCTLAGPEGILTIQNFALEQLLMWIPPPFGMNFPICINVITSLDQIQLVVVSDTGAMNDAYWIAMDFPHEVMALGNLLKTRRVPESAAKAEVAPDADAEKAVQQSLHVLEERLIKIQLALRKMRKKRDDIGKVPALWKTFKIVLPSDEETMSESTSGSGSGDSSYDSDDDSDSDSDDYDDSDDEDSADESGEEETMEKVKTGEAQSASGDATSKKDKVAKVKVKGIETSETPPPGAAKSPRPSKITPLVQQVDETKDQPADRRMSGTPAAPKPERRLSTKPTIFSGAARLSQPNTTIVDVENSEEDAKAPAPVRMPGQLSKRRLSQAAAVIPTVVPPSNRRISRT
ncbi:hypothetical protein BV898_13436 [Hypsibius exemplaris]|uniref:diacylglycerol O-acyltransferase n=1 Tax=Hypsibius exemplaris TaxID=2072580 RepID=A0A1W0WAX7_HYPEX|nr:hypothetical protein BV898_13436 [Hypsibius exemplaris]